MINIVIFGTGSGCEKVLGRLKNDEVKIVAFLDNDSLKWNNLYQEIPILNPEIVKSIDFDYVIIASDFWDEITNQLIKLSINDKKIIQFYKLPLEYICYKHRFFKCTHSVELNEEFLNIYDKCHKFTMTSFNKMKTLYNAVRYIVENKIDGELVECGVWKGGSAMIMAYTLLTYKNVNKKIYLYDTFEGMSEPTEKDKIIYNNKSAEQERVDSNFSSYNDWCYSSIEETKTNLYSTDYSKDNLIFVKGKVEDTIPIVIPQKISILRLDTDWYKSTYHELKYLYPRLVKHGVIIFDDYGYWKGQKDAVDEYFKENNINLFLMDIDGAGVVGVKI